MYKITSLFLFLIIYIQSSIAQKYIEKTNQIVHPEVFFLNGGNNATFTGGKSRKVFTINLPQNTIR